MLFVLWDPFGREGALHRGAVDIAVYVISWQAVHAVLAALW